jgi:phosphoglycerate kinase
LGRPKGKPDPSKSLRPVADVLSRCLGGTKVIFAADCVGAEAQQAVADMRDGQVVLLENLRFHAGEMKNDPEFAAALASLADIYVNDAFSSVHRPHASISGVPSLLPSAAGKFMQKELKALESALSNPARPYTAIIGGVKVESKIGIIFSLLEKADRILLGGAMANTFLKAKGIAVGRSKLGEGEIEVAQEILRKASHNRASILLPADAALAKELSATGDITIADIGSIPEDMMILDIGPKTIKLFIEAAGNEGTMVWNGPLGAAEFAPYGRGTQAVASAIAQATAAGRLTSIAGGGDTVAFLNQHSLTEGFSYVSLAGGAFLEWLSGRPLPGLEALEKAKQRDQT